MSVERGIQPPPLAKEDPETLALRGRPRPAVRFRRGLIVTLTAGAASGIIALAWLALDPPSLGVVRGADSVEPAARTADEVLAGLPRDYGNAPRLGPPLPGDLGRPILDQQRAMAEAAGQQPDPGAMLEMERARATATARERAELARRAALASGVLVPLEGGGKPVAGEPEAVPGPASAAAPRLDGSSPARLRPPPSPWTLSAGTIIPASLVTGLNSDVPGMVIAQVTENVRDSATGRTVLVPQGARLIGAYDSKVAYGQRRAFLAWTRLILPDGASLALDSMPAADAAGQSGLADRVDAHGWQVLKGVALSTLLGVGAQLSLGGGGPLARALRESAQQNGAQTGEQLVTRNLDIKPTVTVRPGFPVRLLLNQDLVLEPWRG